MVKLNEKICDHKKRCYCVKNALIKGYNLIRNGHIIVNYIGEAIYVDILRVSPEELDDIKELIEE